MSLTEQERIERRRGYERKYYRNPANRHKDYARSAVNTALENGRLSRGLSCESCGETTDLEAHHEDYSKPLVVKWLCVACHRAVHRKTHCLRGHALTPDNIYVRPSGKRNCKRCQLDKMQTERDAKKAERIAPWMGTRR
jgi:hypothetical protein